MIVFLNCMFVYDFFCLIYIFLHHFVHFSHFFDAGIGFLWSFGVTF